MLILIPTFAPEYRASWFKVMLDVDVGVAAKAEKALAEVVEELEELVVVGKSEKRIETP